MEGMIDFEVVIVFQSVIALKINLEVAVLTETFLFLNHYRKIENGHLRCCLLLLFVWIISHIIVGKILGLFGASWCLYSKLEKTNAYIH